MLPNGEGTVISRIDPFSKWKMTAEPAAACFQLWVLASSAHAACFSFCEYKTTGCSSAVGWTCQEATISSAPCTVTLCGTLGQSLYCIFFSKVVFLIEQQWMNPITNLLTNYWNSLNPNIVPTRVDHCSGSQCWIGDGSLSGPLALRGWQWGETRADQSLVVIWQHVTRLSASPPPFLMSAQDRCFDSLRLSSPPTVILYVTFNPTSLWANSSGCWETPPLGKHDRRLFVFFPMKATFFF